MSDILKRAVLTGHYAFSEKARVEMDMDGLTELDVAESILNAVAIYKKLRSHGGSQTRSREYLYVIQSTNLGSIRRANWSVRPKPRHYFLISSKKTV